MFDLKEIDFVILLYGFGAAYLELGGHEVSLCHFKVLRLS